MLNLEKVKICYKEYKDKRAYYQKIDEYYFGNTDKLKNSPYLPNRSNARVSTNFVQKLVDEEALYSFGNKITYKAINESQKDAIALIDYYTKNNSACYDSAIGKRLIEFNLGYELSFITKDGRFKNKWLTPLEANGYINEYGELEYFLYIYKVGDKEYIDVYDDKYVYYLDDTFNILETKAHNLGTIPVGVGMVDMVRYTERNGYIEGDKTIFRTIKTLQDALEQNLSDITQEITDFHNAILKFYGIDLEDEVDANGEIKVDALGRPIKREPIVSNNSILYFEDKTENDAQWLIKDINDTFIKNTRDDIKDLIYTLTNHIDNNEKLSSNLSGIALRSKLQCLESRVKSNENAMEDILRKRLQCLFNYLRVLSIGDFDENLIAIEFTPCVPQDISVIADVIAKIPHEVLSNETKRGLLPYVNNLQAEQDKIDKEKEKEEPIFSLDRIGGEDNGEI